nr:hypothetical protein [Providencia sp. 21OH12SH02B-Prov]
MKILPVILCSMSFFIANQANSSPELQKIQNKQGKEIHYYLLKQNEQPAENLLVLIQGSDCRSVINNTNMVENFAIAFPDNDILLVEKTGLDSQVGKDGKEASAEDCPIAYMENDSPLERKDNYLTLLAHFKNSYQHIVLLGGSEGAVVTNLGRVFNIEIIIIGSIRVQWMYRWFCHAFQVTSSNLTSYG